MTTSLRELEKDGIITIDGFIAMAQNYHETPMEFETKNCGIFQLNLNPINGSVTQTVWRCKKHQQCENCNRIFVGEQLSVLENFEQRTKADSPGAHLVCRVVEKKEYDAMRRKVGSDKLGRYPQEDGKILAFFSSDSAVADPERDIPFSPAEYQRGEQSEEERDAIVNMLTPPPGKRSSGMKASRQAVDEETKKKDAADSHVYGDDAVDEEREDDGHDVEDFPFDDDPLPFADMPLPPKPINLEIVVPLLFVKGPQDVVSEAIHAAMAETANLRPQDNDGSIFDMKNKLDSAIYERTQAIRAALWERGLEIKVQYRKVEVAVNYVNWKTPVIT